MVLEYPMADMNVDRLAILAISGPQSSALMKQLSRDDFRFTVIESSGGVLLEPEKVLLIGFNSGRLPALLDLVRQNCSPHRQYIPAQGSIAREWSTLPMVEVRSGGAYFFLMNVERFEQI
jgi:uncharacterized protein YaaQ